MGHLRETADKQTALRDLITGERQREKWEGGKREGATHRRRTEERQHTDLALTLREARTESGSSLTAQLSYTQVTSNLLR